MVGDWVTLVVPPAGVEMATVEVEHTVRQVLGAAVVKMVVAEVTVAESLVEVMEEEQEVVVVD